jgi:hypothetical protein
MLIFANHYYNFGFNVTHISKTKTSRNILGKSILKTPSHKWGKYLNRRQSLSELHKFNWSEASGIGTVLGFNNLRALDVDDCHNLNLISDFLALLNLPEKYPWVTLSGSHNGFHIIFYCPEHRYKTVSGKVKAFKSNKLFREEFKHIELRWSGHLVLPPSLHSSGKNYMFLGGENPQIKPASIQLNHLENLISKFCSNKLETSNVVDINDDELEVSEDTSTPYVDIENEDDELEVSEDTSTHYVDIDNEDDELEVSEDTSTPYVDI